MGRVRLLESALVLSFIIFIFWCNYQFKKHDGLGQRTPQPHMYATLEDVLDLKTDIVHCADLFNGDKDAIRRAVSADERDLKDPQKDDDFINMTKNCGNFRKLRGYLEKPVNKEEEIFPISYSILLYKDAVQFERLLRAIYRPQNFYCVHVDKKSSDTMFRAVESIISCLPNVFHASKRIVVRWGQYSILETELNCMKDLWQNKTWKYFINLTGQEFPLKTNLQIVRALKSLNGSNVDVILKNVLLQRMKSIRIGGQLVLQNPPLVPVNITKGSTHILASRAFVDYMLHDKRAILFNDWVKDTKIPDETYFPTLLNSPLMEVPGALNGGNPALYMKLARYKVWVTKKSSCAGKVVRGFCVFGVGDLQKLSTTDSLFGNKFFSDYQPLTLRCLEELHFNRTKEDIRRSI